MQYILIFTTIKINFSDEKCNFLLETYGVVTSVNVSSGYTYSVFQAKIRKNIPCIKPYLHGRLSMMKPSL